MTALIPALVLFKTSAAMRWLGHLGGPGLVLIGLADNSVVPMPGSMDVLTIWLAARHHQPWPYYALMATVGSIIGGYITYHMARKGGKEALEKKLPKKKVDKAYKKFEEWGFWAVVIPALLPPPFPIVAALLVAGAMQYSRRKFVGALALGRGIRYSIVAYMGSHYGSAVLRFFSRYYLPAVITLVSMSVIAGVYGFYQYRRLRQEQVTNERNAGLTAERAA